MNSGVSLSSGSAGQSAEPSLPAPLPEGEGRLAVNSCHQKSRPVVIATALPVRRSTTHFSTVGDFCKAMSTFSFKGNCLPRRQPPSAVRTTLADALLFRSAMASAEKPPKITQ